MPLGRLSPLLCVLVAAVAPARAELPVPEKIEFNRDVRPILSENCFACHGFDAAQRKAELRLDTKEGVAAAVRGAKTQDDLLKRIRSGDPDELMPPPESGKSLTERQKAVLARWVEQGAQWQGHWSYLKPTRPAVPEVDQPGFVRNPIDKFVLARLKELNLQPSPEADRVTLIRRLSFDLTGLPPTPAEAKAFVEDQSPEAYEKLVDKLLASPAYGERMAAYWLDLVRYADTIGYHSDNPMNAWPYRDYVIKAFNSNKPFDRFTVEQIAGDLLPDAAVEQKVASAYNRLLQTTEEGGAQPKEYAAKYAADRVRNLGSVWLGQTMGCCECHDHKFDPFTTKEFYQLAAFFADVQEAPVGRREPGMPVPDESQQGELKKIDDAIASAKERLNAPAPELAAKQAEWEKNVSGGDVAWTTLKPESYSVRGESKLRDDGDGVLRSVYKVAAKETYTITAKADLKNVTGFRVEALNDPELPAGGPGTAPNGNFVLTNFSVSAGGKPVKLNNSSADYEQNGHPVAYAIDGKNDTGWAVQPQFGKPHFAVFETDKPVESAGAVTLVLEFQSQYPQHNIGKLRLSATTAPSPSRLALPPAVKEALAVAPDKRTDAQKNELAAYYRTLAPELQPVRDELAALEKKKSALMEAMPKVLVTTSGPPREIRVLPRGNWLDETGPVVQPGVPAVLGAGPVADGRQNRLDLAKWLVSPENPLTARVTVNRFWKQFFGTGVSKSLEDLGSQGEWPTHLDLLDWLAVEFRDGGWDVKKTVRLIVTSGTYRQASMPRPELKDRDPYNRLLARQSRYRLDAEQVRDNALAVSGLLVNKVGGRSVFPYQPPGYWFALNFPVREWQNDTGENLYRRGLYTHWQRSFLHPSLLAFDAPSREECTVDRPRSNVPQQALALLNDPTYVEAARALAERTIREGGAAPADRLNYAFERALNRKPKDEEVKVLTALLEKHSSRYGKDAEAAKKLIAAGAKPVPTDLNPSELAAWTSVARVILNLHETITRP
ncbi:MAG TPA: PSD1 and planctomycete cytochrome C domain-containing protein [Tepidisphaeraceae bacterium]|nr:PSD1 and planctomycete cytochrome C domain-containing protein [Tepidisphaeraceae bacterium]